MDVILSRIKCFGDFLTESTNSENFPILKQVLLKYKNVESSKLSLKVLKHIFIILGSNQYFDTMFTFSMDVNPSIKEQGNVIYDALINNKYNVEIMPLLHEYIQKCNIYKQESQKDALKHYFYGYCECDVIGSKNTEMYYYPMLEIELQYLRTRIMNDIGTINGIKGIEKLKTFLESYSYNGVLYYSNEKELTDTAIELFWKEFEISDGTPFMVPLIKHFKREYYKISSQYKSLVEDVLDTDLMEINISMEKNDVETVLSNILGYVDFITERMIEIDAQANDEMINKFHDKIIDDLENERKITTTIKEFFQYVFGRLDIIYNLKKFVYDSKNKNKTI